MPSMVDPLEVSHAQPPLWCVPLMHSAPSELCNTHISIVSPFLDEVPTLASNLTRNPNPLNAIRALVSHMCDYLTLDHATTRGCMTAGLARTTEGGCA